MKRVKCLMGVAGVAPAALGLLAQGPPAAAAPHTAKPVSTADRSAKWGKSVRVDPGQAGYLHPDGTCSGTTEKTRTLHFGSKWLEIGFWSNDLGAKTCIGTIFVHGSGMELVDASVAGKDGKAYCTHSPVAPPLQYICRGSFYTPFKVVGYGASVSGLLYSVPYTIG